MKAILAKYLRLLLSLVDKSTFKGEIMYIVKDDNPAVNFTVEFEATDAEGHAVDESQLTVEAVSDDTGVLSVDAFDPATGAGTVSFGAPGVANLNVTVMFGETMLGSFGAQFTVTTGDPAAIEGGTITFDGLQEV